MIRGTSRAAARAGISVLRATKCQGLSAWATNFLRLLCALSAMEHLPGGPASRYRGGSMSIWVSEDGRGRRFRLIEPGATLLLPVGRSRPRTAAGRAASYVPRAVRMKLFWNILLAPVCGIAWASAVALCVFTPGFWPRYAIPAFSLIAVGIMVMMFRAIRFRSELIASVPHVIDGALRDGYCAVCGYSLGGLEPELDGCTVCPMCSAAWRVPAA